jgi:hypothetical protein
MSSEPADGRLPPRSTVCAGFRGRGNRRGLFRLHLAGFKEAPALVFAGHDDVHAGNVLAALPKSVHAGAKNALAEIIGAAREGR